MKYTSLKISTTGLDKFKDEILRVVAIEFSVDDETKPPYQIKIENTIDVFIKPTVAFDVDTNFHNFTKQDVIDKGFIFNEKVSKALAKYIEGKNITGFNVDNFDLAFLYEFYKRNHFVLDLSNTKTFDTFQMDSLLYPRNFCGIYKRYTGRIVDKEFTKDALQVAKSNIDIFSIEYINAREQGFLEDIGNPIISPEHFVEFKNDELLFTYGKYQYKNVAAICLTDPQYIKWVFSFATETTKQTIQNYFYEKFPEKLKK